jgi:hypothetical protein
VMKSSTDTGMASYEMKVVSQMNVPSSSTLASLLSLIERTREPRGGLKN